MEPFGLFCLSLIGRLFLFLCLLPEAEGASCCFSISVNADIMSCSLCCILLSLIMASLWHPSGPNTSTVNAMLPSYLNSRESSSVMS
uniref:Secreted protein n=1 Tax=Arundo donax TaxID=35708 RepID=A0A0A9B7L3_ARUDO